MISNSRFLATEPLEVDFEVLPSAEEMRDYALSNPAYIPTAAEFLIHLFYDRQKAESLCGDLQERFKSLSLKFGYRRACFWYWWQTLRSVGPLVWAWLAARCRLICKVVAAVSGALVAKKWIGSESWGALLAEILKLAV